MKIQIGFRDEVVAIGYVKGGKVRWKGIGKGNKEELSKRAKQVESAADYYSRVFKVSNNALLGLMVDRMRGMWWAEEVK
jgi:hypothetical protein